MCGKTGGVSKQKFSFLSNFSRFLTQFLIFISRLLSFSPKSSISSIIQWVRFGVSRPKEYTYSKVSFPVEMPKSQNADYFRHFSLLTFQILDIADNPSLLYCFA